MKAVLLDVDGTLVASNRAHAAAWSRAFASCGYRVDAERILGWIGMGGDKILRKVDAALTPDSGTGKAIGERRKHVFLEEYAGRLEPTPGARELLERLGAAGLQRVVATSAQKDELDAILGVAGLTNSVDKATTADDVDRSKPDADIVHAALHAAQCDARDAVLIGDTPYDVEAARRAGVRAIAVRCGGWNDAGLSGAAAIYDDPADILAHFEACFDASLAPGEHGVRA